MSRCKGRIIRTYTVHTSNEVSMIPEWDGCSPNAIIRRLKAVNKEEVKSPGLREFWYVLFHCF
jgi:hypothetical protein